MIALRGFGQLRPSTVASSCERSRLDSRAPPSYRVGAAGELANRRRLASTIAATTGPDVMNSSNDPKNGLPSCSAQLLANSR